MIFNAVRKEMNMSNNFVRNVSQEFQPIVVSENVAQSNTPRSRKHKFEEDSDGGEEGPTNVAKCQRSNSLGSYFHPIVPEIENSVKASQLHFNELEIVDDSMTPPKQPESVFQFVNSLEHSTSKNHHILHETAECKFTSNCASDHAMYSSSACDDVNLDPRFFQSQSAPALLLSCDDDALATPNTTTPYTPQNTTSNPSVHPSSESAAKNQVNSHSGFEYKLRGFSPSTDRNTSSSATFDAENTREKGMLSIHTVSEDWNNDDFDALTTGDSSLCGSSSRRSAAPSRSSHRSSSHHHHYYYQQDQDHYHPSSSRTQSSSDKVSTHSDDTYTTRSSYTDTRSTSGYARRSHSSAHYRDRGYGKSSSGTTTHTTRTTYSTNTYTTTETTHTTHTRRRSSSSGQVSGAFDTTSNMYSSVYSTTNTGAGVSDRCPTPPRSTPPLVRSKVSGNEYSDSSYTDLATSPAHTAHTAHTSTYTPCSPSTYTVHTAHATKTLPTTKPVNFRYHRSGHYCDLPLEWWERTDHCKEAKLRHTDRIDHMCGSRESLVLKTTLWKDDVVLEPNMFPYYTPYGVEHYTLWSIDDMSHQQIVSFVDRWLYRHMPQVRRWQYDDNSGERSIDLFHVHVFIETAPYTYAPREGMLYVPPHAALEEQVIGDGVRDGGSAESAIVL